MSRIKKMSTWASSLIGPDVFPLLFFFVPSNLLFVLFPFIFFLFHVVKGRTFRRGSTDFSFCKILFPLLSFQFFFFFCGSLVCNRTSVYYVLIMGSPAYPPSPLPMRYRSQTGWILLSPFLYRVGIENRDAHWKFLLLLLLFFLSLAEGWYFICVRWKQQNIQLEFFIFPYIFVYNFFFSPIISFFFFILSVLSNVHTIIILFPVWW